MRGRGETFGAGLDLAVPAALCGYALVLFSRAVLNDADTYWHIAAGEWILANRAVPHLDPFSFTFAGRPWVSHEWLSEVPMALAFRWSEWNGVLILFGTVAALLFGILAFQLRRWLSLPSALAVLVFASVCIAPHLLARPHILALLMLVIWTSGLLNALHQGRAPSLLLLPVMALWANLHGSFVFGIAVSFPIALEAFAGSNRPWTRTAREWGIFIAGAAAAAAFTPNGIEGLLHPFNFLKFKHISMIDEWKAPDFTKYQPLEVAIIVFLYFSLSRGLRLPIPRLLLLLGLLHMALQHSRHQMVASIVGALIVAEPIARTLARENGNAAAQRGRGHVHPAWWAIGCLRIIACLTLARQIQPLRLMDGPSSPISALEHVSPELTARPVFNDYNFGGYLIFKGIRPFIDGRADMYGDDFMLSVYAPMFSGKREIFSKNLDDYGIRWTILRPDTGATSALDALPGWHRIYADSIAVVHVRVDEKPLSD